MQYGDSFFHSFTILNFNNRSEQTWQHSLQKFAQLSYSRCFGTHREETHRGITMIANLLLILDLITRFVDVNNVYERRDQWMYEAIPPQRPESKASPFIRFSLSHGLVSQNVVPGICFGHNLEDRRFSWCTVASLLMTSLALNPFLTSLDLRLNGYM